MALPANQADGHELGAHDALPGSAALAPCSSREPVKDGAFQRPARPRTRTAGDHRARRQHTCAVSRNGGGEAPNRTWLGRAVESSASPAACRPDDQNAEQGPADAMFNLGNLLVEAGRGEEAESWRRRAREVEGAQ